MVAGGAFRIPCASALGEAGEIFAAERQHEPGLRAELPHAHGHRVLQPLGDLRAAFAECSRQDEDRIEAAHLRENRDRLRARSGGIKQARGPQCGNR